MVMNAEDNIKSITLKGAIYFRFTLLFGFDLLDKNGSVRQM